MKINEFDKRTVEIVRARINEALTGLVHDEELNLKFELGRITYRKQSLGVKLEVSIVGDDGAEVESKAAATFNAQCNYYGMKKAWLGMVFVHGVDDATQEYQIKGLNTRAKRYPVETVRVRDGRPFKFPASIVIAKMNDTEAELKQSAERIARPD